MRKSLLASLAVIAASIAFALPVFAQTVPSSITVNLSHDEAQAVLSLLDKEVKSGGLQAAKAFSPIADKIIAGAQAAAKADDDAKVKAAVEAAKSEAPAK